MEPTFLSTLVFFISKSKVERQRSDMLVRDVKDLTFTVFYVCSEEATIQDMYENQKAFFFFSISKKRFEDLCIYRQKCI